MAERANTIPGGGRPLPFQIFDLDSHPDGKLLRLCGKMTRLQDQWEQPAQAGSKLAAQTGSTLARDYWETAEQIATIHPKTPDGFQMKALVALAMLAPGARQVGAITGGSLSVWTGAVAIVRDVIRGLPQ